jgi:hypothetical protein
MNNSKKTASPAPPEFPTTEQAALVLFRSAQTLRGWACTARGPIDAKDIHRHGKRLAWRRVAVLALIESCKESSEPELISTAAAAKLLMRKPQTLRVWATNGSGPIKPVRVNGRLGWPKAAIHKLIRTEPRRLSFDLA